MRIDEGGQVRVRNLLRCNPAQPDFKTGSPLGYAWDDRAGASMRGYRYRVVGCSAQILRWMGREAVHRSRRELNYDECSVRHESQDIASWGVLMVGKCLPGNGKN